MVQLDSEWAWSNRIQSPVWPFHGNSALVWHPIANTCVNVWVGDKRTLLQFRLIATGLPVYG